MSGQIDIDRLISLKEASEYLIARGLDMKVSTLQKKVQHGKITHYRCGNRPKFTIKDLETYIGSFRVAQKAEWPDKRRLA